MEDGRLFSCREGNALDGLEFLRDSSSVQVVRPGATAADAGPCLAHALAMHLAWPVRFQEDGLDLGV